MFWIPTFYPFFTIMSSITTWEEINTDLGSDVSHFDDWLEDNSEDVTIFVTGIFKKDMELYRNEKEGNVKPTC